MAVYVSPGVYVREVDLSLYLRNLSTTVCGMVGTTPRGPVNVPTLITNINSFVSTFGRPHPNYLAMYAAVEALRSTNQLWFVRVNSAESVAADVDIDGSAVAATVVSSLKGPFAIVDDASATLLGTDQAATVAVTSTNKFLLISVNGGPQVTVTLTEGGARTKAQIATDIDTALASYGGDSSVAGTNQIQINSTATGSTTSVTLYTIANSAYTDLGFTLTGGVLSASGTDSTRAFRIISVDNTTGTPVETPQNVSLTLGAARTVDQLVTELNAAFTVPITVDNYSGSLRFTHDSIGQKFAIKFSNASTANVRTATTLGLDTNVDHWGYGLNPASLTLNVAAQSVGEWGNLLSVTVAAGSVAGSFKLTVLEDGAVVEVFDRLVGHPDLEDDDLGTEYFLTAINGTGVSPVSKYITVTDTLTNTGAPVNGTYVLAGGADGLGTVSDDDYIGVSTGSTVTGLQVFANAERINVNVIATPGVHSAAVIQEMIAICEARGDAMALIDPPLGLGVQQVVDWHNGAGAYSDHSAFNSSYAALYWPWLMTYDSNYDRYVWTPPSGHMMAVYATSDQMAEPWYAPAGLNRGRVLQVTKVEYDADQGARDLLNGGSNAVNPIVNFVPDGITVWGQRTLQRKPTALDRVNVRRMMLYLRKVIATSTRQLVFEPNDSTLWRTFKALVDPFLRGILTARGITAYSVVCDETTNTPEHIDNNEMVARIFIQPTKAAEKILVDAVLTPTGATFDELVL